MQKFDFEIMTPYKPAIMDSNKTGEEETFFTSSDGLEVEYGGELPRGVLSRGCSDHSRTSILDVAQNMLVSAHTNLVECENTLTRLRGSADATPSLADLARLHNVQKVRKAVMEMTNVIARLLKSLVHIAEQGVVAEKVYTPVVVNTIAKESAEIESVSNHLPTSKEDRLTLEKTVNAIRDAVMRCLDAFEPTRQAVFRPNRRRQEGDRVGNQTREYLRSLDVDWSGICRVRDALPDESKLVSLFGCDLEKQSMSEKENQLGTSGSLRYWPVQ